MNVLWRWCVWCLLDSSRVIPAGCSGMSSGLSIKAGPEFPISLRFEFGADSLIWTPPFQYVEPGVHLANYANYHQTNKTISGVQPSLWICYSNPWTHDWETKSRTAESDHFLPEILHPIHSKMGENKHWELVPTVEVSQPKLLRDSILTYTYQADSI